MTAVTAAELLDKAAEVLERDGWCRNTFESPSGQRCVSGNLIKALSELTGSSLNWMSSPLYEEAREALVELLGSNSIVAWNDEKALDGADVVNHLRKAAEIARGAE